MSRAAEIRRNVPTGTAQLVSHGSSRAVTNCGRVTPRHLDNLPINSPSGEQTLIVQKSGWNKAWTLCCEYSGICDLHSTSDMMTVRSVLASA